jgi:DNA topoisomerase-2
MKLAFNKKMTHQRKEWLANWVHAIGADEVEVQPISWFINQELILFSMADVQRSIPKMMDGFKESHRKIMHGAHLKFNIGPLDKDYKELKVAQFSGFIAEKVNYHHGELILDDVIVGMAQDFVGANNISWFTKDGQFGTRLEGGKDASETRYTYTRPEKTVSYILRKEDQPILTSVIDEGEEVEPETYYPIIPMVLVNGAQGIGTGYSTFIPNHSPLDIINWLRLKLQGVEDDELPDIIPWYKGFTGKINIIDRSKKRHRNKVSVTIVDNSTSVPKVQKIQEADDVYEPVDESLGKNSSSSSEEEVFEEEERPLLSMITEGKFTITPKGVIIINELPIGRWSGPYEKWLGELLEEKIITNKYNQSVDDTVYFEISGFNLNNVSYKALRLQKTYGMSNMVVLNQNGKPVRYDTSFELMQDFYKQRLVIYQKRKDYMISNLLIEINTLREKIKFIRAVKDKELRIINRPKNDVYADIDRLGLSREFYDKDTVKIRNLSKDDIDKLEAKIASKEELRNAIINTSIKDIWIRELNELEAVIKTQYNMNVPKRKVKLSVDLEKSKIPVKKNIGRARAGKPPVVK